MVMWTHSKTQDLSPVPQNMIFILPGFTAKKNPEISWAVSELKLKKKKCCRKTKELNQWNLVNEWVTAEMIQQEPSCQVFVLLNQVAPIRQDRVGENKYPLYYCVFFVSFQAFFLREQAGNIRKKKPTLISFSF